MRKLLVTFAFALLVPFAAQGQTANSEPDFQFRIPVQFQGKHMAAWVVLPDLTAPGNHGAVLMVAGPMFRYGKEDKSSIQTLTGARLNQDRNRYVDPLLNLRVSEGRIPRVSVFADIQFFPREARRRFYWLVFAETPVAGSLKIGAEAEGTHPFGGRRDIAGAGPRASWAPPGKLPVRFAVAYHVRNGQDIVRFYVAFNFR